MPTHRDSHVNPQRPAEVFYPPGHPKYKGEQPIPPGVQVPVIKPSPNMVAKPNPHQVQDFAGETVREVENAEAAEDLGDMIRAIDEMANELHEQFFGIPDLAEAGGRVAPESFNASTRLAFVSVGNALDYAIRLVTEKGQTARIAKLKSELAAEMRAAGMTGEPPG